MLFNDLCSMLKLRAAVVCVAVWLIAVPGCGAKATYPVAGKVVLKGQADAKALTGYLVTLESTEQRVSGFGEIQADGTFQITTFAEGDGAVPGKHRIAVTPPTPDSDQPRPPSKIDTRYLEFSNSGLETEIRPGKNEVVLELDPVK